MAMIDYGAVVFKDGFLINENEYFMDMLQSVGWSDAEDTAPKYPNGRIDGNHFVYVGDEVLTVAVYKTVCRILSNKRLVVELYGMKKAEEFEKMFRRQSLHFSVDGIRFHLRRIGDEAIYLLRFAYRGSHYNIVYGYGIDPDMAVWNKIKVRYLGKKVAKKVDRLYQKIKKGWCNDNV